MNTNFDIEAPRAVALLANLVRAFRAREVELHFDGEQMALLERLQEEGLVDLTNDGFRLTAGSGSYVANSLTPPVTAKGVLFLERLPVDKFVDRPGLFRFLGWL
jgi:hypothetical protein